MYTQTIFQFAHDIQCNVYVKWTVPENDEWEFTFFLLLNSNKQEH